MHVHVRQRAVVLLTPFLADVEEAASMTGEICFEIHILRGEQQQRLAKLCFVVLKCTVTNFSCTRAIPSCYSEPVVALLTRWTEISVGSNKSKKITEGTISDQSFCTAHCTIPPIILTDSMTSM